MSFAGLIACEVKVRDGRESAAAQTLEEEDDGGLAGPVGEAGEVTADWPWLDERLCNWRAFARAFSCVRTK